MTCETFSEGKKKNSKEIEVMQRESFSYDAVTTSKPTVKLRDENIEKIKQVI